MNKKIKTLQLIHLAICFTIIFAYIFIGEFTMEQLKGQKINSEDLVYLVIPFAAFFLSNSMFRSQLKQGNARTSLEEKIPIYQTASIIRWSILEGAAFLILFIKF